MLIPGAVGMFLERQKSHNDCSRTIVVLMGKEVPAPRKPPGEKSSRKRAKKERKRSR